MAVHDSTAGSADHTRTGEGERSTPSDIAMSLAYKAEELGKLFTIISRLVDSKDEEQEDLEIRYIAKQGHEFAFDLANLLDQFHLDLNSTRPASPGRKTASNDGHGALSRETPRV